MSAQKFKTADDAVEQLEREGWVKDNYDELYPWVIAWNDNDGMRARIAYDHNRECYYIEGCHV